VHPQAVQESILGHCCWAGKIWRVGEVYLVVLACVLRATTKKDRQLFWRKKCTPGETPGTT